MPKQITNTSYPIFIGDFYTEMDAFIFQLQPKVSKTYILVDENTHLHCIPSLIRNSSLLGDAEILEIESGESEKNLEICYHLWQTLAENNIDRNALIINLGGGVITDMGGFIASTYKRGIRFINIPTTLLAMIDAAVGGKTGINLGVLKNHIGCFNNPSAVFINPVFLETLPQQELQSGLGELLKYSLISSHELWNRFKQTTFDNKTDWQYFIESALKIKTQIVEQDPKESGLRKILNFGHTYGHAFESLSLSLNSDNHLLHGEAVALGIICELWHSVEKMNFPKSIFEEIKELIFNNFRTFSFNESHIDILIDFMKKDKKNDGSQIACILLENIGNVNYETFISEMEIRDCLTYFIEQ
ncbi:MAG: 3-dehydroquinate synthase [Bacteroidetes bacterium]|nr:MAG: 3-dehydroquinate synthase [Bacteroidota bacterium]